EIGGNIISVFETENEEILVGTTNGLIKIDEDGKTHHLLKNVWVQGIEAFKTNVFWIAIYKKILLINNVGEKIREYQIPESLEKYQDGSTYSILSIYKDNENTLYVGTTRG